MYQLRSDADAAFMGSLGWSTLLRWTCSSVTEGMMHVGELAERANATRSDACQELREGQALREQLQATIVEIKVSHAKEDFEVSSSIFGVPNPMQRALETEAGVSAADRGPS
ncbi:uncharacterized protein [Primulina eburnea]|uniref:uncharacterized protein n=1 Tax=Primulina eburnea TaxID=1245227 RepID=UPI003C6C70D3